VLSFVAMPSPPRNDLDSVCLSCGVPNGPDRDFCFECGAPLTAHAVNDAFDSIRSRAWAVGKSLESPKLIVVIGNWLLFGPGLLVGYGGLLTCLVMIFKEPPRGLWEMFLAFLLAPVGLGGIAYFSTVVLVRTMTSYAEGKTRVADESDDDHDEEHEPVVPKN